MRDIAVGKRISAVVVALSAVGLGSTAVAAGPVISDDYLGITLTLPDGFEPIPDFQSPPNMDIRHAYRRLGSEGQVEAVVLIDRMPGVIGRERVGEEEARKFGAAEICLEKWKSFELEVFVVTETQDGVAVITRNAQIPTVPYAIQLKVSGLASRDAELAELTRSLLASLEGKSNWLTEGERAEKLGEAVGKMAIWIALVGAGVYGLSSWRTGAFRAKALAMGLPADLAAQKIRPSWAWYLLGAYLLLAGLMFGSLVTLTNLRRSRLRRALWDTLGVWAAALVAASIVTGFIMWRRVRTKRRILATAPPLTEPPALPPRMGG